MSLFKSHAKKPIAVNPGELLELQRRDENLATYSVGDYVMCYSPQGGGNMQIGVIVEAKSLPGTSRGVAFGTLPTAREFTWWRVRVRFSDKWSLHALERRVQRALTPAELAHNRRLGLIPSQGMPEVLF